MAINEIKVGDLVEIITGQFIGERAEIIEIIPNMSAVKVKLIDLKNIAIPVVLRADCVKKLNNFN